MTGSGGGQKSDTRCDTNLKIILTNWVSSVTVKFTLVVVVVVAACRATFTLSDTGVIYVTSTQNGKKESDKGVERSTDMNQVRVGGA